jgi:hypothetical protein
VSSVILPTLPAEQYQDLPREVLVLFGGRGLGFNTAFSRQTCHVKAAAHMVEHGFAGPLGIPFAFAHFGR